jgi:predicted O-methyltransferase YrrM
MFGLLTPNEPLHGYLRRVSLRESDALRRLREETERLPEGDMGLTPESAQLLALLARLMGAKRVLEVGTFTGYSTLALALALPEDGEMMACDVEEAWTNLGRRHWEAAGVAHKIDLRLAPALDTLTALLKTHTGLFDLVLIDADKENYASYVELALLLLRPGGLIALDNTLWGGKVADMRVKDPDTQALRALNEKLHADERVELCLVPIGDGLTLLRRRDVIT